MFEALLQYGDLGLLVLRLAIAAIFIYHAVPKLMDSKGMAQGMGMSAGMVMGLGIVELVSSLGLIFGIYTQLAALMLGIVMIGATYFKMQKWHVPFFATDKTGWEFDFLLLAASIAVLLTGGGSIGLGIR